MMVPHLGHHENNKHTLTYLLIVKMCKYCIGCVVVSKILNKFIPSIYMQAVALKKVNDREAKHPQIHPNYFEINHLQ